MNKFGTIFGVELGRMFKSKTFIVIVILILIFSILMVVTTEIMKEVLPPVVNGDGKSAETHLTEYKAALALYDEQVSSGAIKKRFNDTTRIKLTSAIAYYEYLIENDLDPSTTYPYTTDFVFGNMFTTGIGLSGLIMDIGMQLALIMMVIFACRNMAGEISEGNMRMLLLRPVTRGKVFTAKWLAVFVIGFITMAGTTVLGMIYSLLRMDIGSKAVVMVLNNSKAFLSNSVGIFGLNFFSNLLYMFVILQLTYYIGTVSKSKVAGMVVGLVFVFGGNLLSQLLNLIALGYIDISNNLNISMAFQLGSVPINGMNLYSMLIISLVYLSIFMTTNYLVFKSQDIS